MLTDIDGAEDGDQGKSRKPHDHNRDYTDEKIYVSTKALTARLPSLFAAADFHSPGFTGGRNDFPYIVRKKNYRESQVEFGKIFESVTRENAVAKENVGTGRIIYDGLHDIEPDTEWNKSDTPNASLYFKNAGAVFALSLETPYFGAGKMRYTQDNLMDFGYDFGKAFELYLTKLP